MKIKNITQVRGRMPIGDPFILGAYHYDQYPEGNGKMGPNASLAGRELGNDFNPEEKWRMYHGHTIPGFPHHPHRGFEVITIIPEGYADHFDSRGSKGRYGEGDVQLMSAGSGVLHAEMFPLIHDDRPNPLRLFQIWLNLPGKDKLTEPNYKMLWSGQIPEEHLKDTNGGNVHLKVILGEYAGTKSEEPLKHSWAADPQHHVGLALLEMDPGTEFTLPSVAASMNRYVFFYEGKSAISIDNHVIPAGYLVDLGGDEIITIKNGDQPAKLFILEGEPIREPIAAHGPFVMNTQAELQQAFEEYRRTEFGGWPWGETEADLVNPKDSGRFASYDFGKSLDTP